MKTESEISFANGRQCGKQISNIFILDSQSLADLYAENAAKRRKAKLAEIMERANQPIKGTTGDLGQMELIPSKQPELFSR